MTPEWLFKNVMSALAVKLIKRIAQLNWLSREPTMCGEGGVWGGPVKRNLANVVAEISRDGLLGHMDGRRTNLNVNMDVDIKQHTKRI